MEKTKGMTTCKICGREFSLIIENHYVAKEAGKVGFAALAGGPAPLLFDAFDCPHCGCQNVMQQRHTLSDIMGQDYPPSYEDEEAEGCCCCGSDACKLNKGEQE